MTQSRAPDEGGWSRPWWIAYFLVWALPAIGLAIRILQGTQQGDLFEHAAAVRALAADLVHPGNPLFAVDAPHTLYSPYSLVLALIVRATGLDPFVALSFAGFVNLLVLALGFRSFVRVFTRSAAAVVLAALLTILLWGSASLPFGHDPWIWSGFLNLTSLTYGLPYPSTLAMGLAFFAVSAGARAFQAPRTRDLLTIGAIQALVLVMHPYTAAFLGIALVALALSQLDRSTLVRAVQVFGAFAIGTGVALLWPYYPVPQLFAGQAAAFDWEQQEMYAFLVRRIYPALIGVVFLLDRFRKNVRDPLVLLAVGVGLVYGLGYLTHRYTLGRELPFLVLTLDLATAIGLTDLWDRRNQWSDRLGRFGPNTGRTVVGIVAIAVVIVIAGVAALGIRWDLTTGSSHAAVQQLAERTAPTDVVMADPQSTYAVPAWGGKIVGWGGAVGFIPDIQQRRDDMAAFFDPATNDADRRRLLDRYGARWILFDRGIEGMTPDLEAAIERLGSRAAVSDDGEVVLIRVPA